MSVHLIIVSHSAKLAEGVCELAGQMSGDSVRLLAAGGDEAGNLGTSATRIFAALEDALSNENDAALILLDLGSAAMNAALALEMLDPAARDRVKIAEAPLVEGAVLAAVCAASGADLATVAAEATTGRDMPKIL